MSYSGSHIPQNSGAKWYAVMTKPRQETIAEDNLLRQGFHCFLPKAINPYQKRSRQNKSERIEPLFPRYLFIHVNSSEKSISPVRSTRGVNGLVSFGKKVAEVPDQVIQQIKQKLNARGLVEIEPVECEVGDRVTLFDGPFAGMEGLFKEVVGQTRALLLMDFLTGSTTVKVDRKLLKKAN